MSKYNNQLAKIFLRFLGDISWRDILGEISWRDILGDILWGLLAGIV